MVSQNAPNVSGNPELAAPTKSRPLTRMRPNGQAPGFLNSQEAPEPVVCLIAWQRSVTPGPHALWGRKQWLAISNRYPLIPE